MHSASRDRPKMVLRLRPKTKMKKEQRILHVKNSLPSDSCFEHSVQFALLASVSDLLQNHSQIGLRDSATNELQTRNDLMSLHSAQCTS